ncbi:hypothetical protein M569_14087, partial [Genlisea aurea]
MDAAVTFFIENFKVFIDKVTLFIDAKSRREQLQKDLETMESYLAKNANKNAKSKNFDALEKQI